MSFIFAFYGQFAKQAFASIKSSYTSLNSSPASLFERDFYNGIPHFVGCSTQTFEQKNANLKHLAQNAPIRLENDRIWCNNLEDLEKRINSLSGSYQLAFEVSIKTATNQRFEGLALAVSPFNPQTLFIAKLPDFANTFCVCSHIEPLINLVGNEIDTQAISLWLAGRPDPNMCNYKHIQQVPQGHLLLLPLTKNDASIDTTRNIDCVKYYKFWDIDPNVSVPLHSDEASSKFEQLLASSIKECITSKPLPIFAQLSGGMDSTSVSALAYNSISHPDKQLHSISHTYKNTQSCDETDNIHAMQAKFKFAQSHFIELDKYTQLSFKDLYPTHMQSPGMVLSPKYQEEASLLLQHNATLLLTGNGGDEMCWGHSFAYYDHFRDGNIRIIKEVYKSAKALNLSGLRTIKSVLLKPYVQFSLLPLLKAGQNAKQQALIRHGLTLPPWLTEKSAELVNQQQLKQLTLNPFADEQGNTPYGLAKYARYEGLFYTATFNSMRSYQAVFEPYGLEVAHPFFNKQLAEFSFAIDQREHISGQYPKLLLRKAMDKHLPKQVCWNTHKTIFDQHFAKLVKESKDSLRELLSHEGLQDLGLVDNQVILTTFDNVVNQSQPSLNVDLLYAILVQSWYQTHIVKS